MSDWLQVAWTLLNVAFRATFTDLGQTMKAAFVFVVLVPLLWMLYNMYALRGIPDMTMTAKEGGYAVRADGPVVITAQTTATLKQFVFVISNPTDHAVFNLALRFQFPYFIAGVLKDDAESVGVINFTAAQAAAPIFQTTATGGASISIPRAPRTPHANINIGEMKPRSRTTIIVTVDAHRPTVSGPDPSRVL